MAATRVPYPTGQRRVEAGWEAAAVYRWRLYLGDWTPDPSVQVFAVDIPGTKCTAGGYADLAAIPGGVTITLPTDVGSPGFITYPATDPDFGVLSGGQKLVWLVLLAHVTNDTDSPICSAWKIAHTCDGVADAVFELPDTGVLTSATMCTGVF